MQRRAIEQKEIVWEILSGTTDAKLMEKYDLSVPDLENVFRTLVDIRAINHIDVLAWSIFGNKVISTERIRLFPRDSLEFTVPVFELMCPEREGVVKNVSRTGLCVKGMTALVNEIKTFSIALDLSRQVVSHPFEARCRWTRRNEISGEMESGYAIVESSRKTWNKLLNGIKLVRHLVSRRARRAWEG